MDRKFVFFHSFGSSDIQELVVKHKYSHKTHSLVYLLITCSHQVNDYFLLGFILWQQGCHFRDEWKQKGKLWLLLISVPTRDKLVNGNFQTGDRPLKMTWMNDLSTLAEPQKINKSHRGKIPKPCWARAALRCVGVSLWRSRGLRWVFLFRTCWSRDCLKKQRTVKVLLSVKRVGRLYQGALWENQWEWSRWGNDSHCLFEREQKQTAEGRNMIENSDTTQLSRGNCFLMVHVFQRRGWNVRI